MAVTFGWQGVVDTDLQFSEFYASNHTVVVWFLLQYPNAYVGPIFSVNGSGNYLVGQGDRNTQSDAHLISRIEAARGVHLPAAFAAGRWYHLAVVRNGNDINLFLDGQPLGPTLTVTGANPPVGTLRLGRPSTGKVVDGQEAQFYGMMDELAVYNRALTNAEILAQFTNRVHLLGNELGLLEGWLFTPTPLTRPAPRLQRPFVRSGETALVPNSANWSGTDMRLIPLPTHDEMELPFLAGEAWVIPQGFAAAFSHRGYAAFCWDFAKADVGTGWGDVYPNGSFKAPVYSTNDGEVTLETHSSPPVSPGDDETENMVWVKSTDGFTRQHLHLLKDSNRVSVGQRIKSGQPIAQISTEWRCSPAGPHLHFATAADPLNPRAVTMPTAFSNYEVRQSNGSWAFVSRGIPQQGEVVRRTGSMSSWDEIGHANRVTAMTAMDKKIFAATTDNKLWWRDPVSTNIVWDPIGHANKVVAIAAINCKLFAVTTDNKLWWRDPVGTEVNWDHIGYANNVVAMAATNGKLFAATRDNKLWWRDPIGSDISWGHIGHANNVVALAATNGKLFAATKDNKLWWRDPVGSNVYWDHIGHANNVVAMAGINGKLFAATNDNKLWVRGA